MSIDDQWLNMRNALESKVSTVTWNAGLNSLRLVDYAENVLTLSVPNTIQLNRVQDRYLDVIQEVVDAELGSGVYLQLTVDLTAPERRLSPESPAPSIGASKPSVSTPARRDIADNASRIDPRMTFESFVPGPSNRLAYSAAQSVAERPAGAYNPLLIHGSSGLGKTHLLHAIGNYITALYPSRRIVYITTETFLNDFIKAIREKEQITLHSRYRECDVLLIDDIQFLEPRGESFHEEIFHTYNALYSEGKQIVLSSDRSPRDMGGLQDRFRSRLLQGLITEIDKPDLETRIAILQSRAEYERVELPNDVVDYIANRVRDNIRELEGAVTMLRAHASLRQVPITLSLAQQHLSNLGADRVVLKPEQIIDTVGRHYGLSSEELRGHSRLRPLVTARHVAMYLIRDMLVDYSYPTIAQIFGGRNHTTVMSAVTKIEKEMSTDQELVNTITDLKRHLQVEN
jgi:chromosomal replication initiator protein